MVWIYNHVEIQIFSHHTIISKWTKKWMAYQDRIGTSVWPEFFYTMWGITLHQKSKTTENLDIWIRIKISNAPEAACENDSVFITFYVIK